MKEKIVSPRIALYNGDTSGPERIHLKETFNKGDGLAYHLQGGERRSRPLVYVEGFHVRFVVEHPVDEPDHRARDQIQKPPRAGRTQVR